MGLTDTDAKNPFPPIALIVPGTLFWVLVIAGGVTGNTTLIGAGVALLVVTLTAFGITKVAASSNAKAARDRVWAEGTPGTATVVRLDATGATINHSPQVELTLEVAVPGRPPFQTKVTTYVSQLVIPRVQPGCTFAVKVDPADPTVVAVDPDLL